MRLYLTCFCLFLLTTTSAQSVFDKNNIYGDDLREMIVELFESKDGQVFQQADAENGQDAILLVNSAVSTNNENMDITNALVDLRSNPYDLNLLFSIQIFEEGNHSEVSPPESLRAIRFNVMREENVVTLHFWRQDISYKKLYNLFAVYKRIGDNWELVNQNLEINS